MITLLTSTAVLLQTTFSAAGQPTAALTTTPLTSAAVLLKATFTAAGQPVAVLMTMKSSSAVMPILKMLICMAVIKAPIPAIPLPLTAGAAIRNLYKTSTILLLKISTGMKINPYLQLQQVVQLTLTKPQLIPFTLQAEAILTLTNQRRLLKAEMVMTLA